MTGGFAKLPGEVPAAVEEGLSPSGGRVYPVSAMMFSRVHDPGGQSCARGMKINLES
jgi:hypothetical protein